MIAKNEIDTVRDIRLAVNYLVQVGHRDKTN